VLCDITLQSWHTILRPTETTQSLHKIFRVTRGRKIAKVDVGCCTKLIQRTTNAAPAQRVAHKSTMKSFKVGFLLPFAAAVVARSSSSPRLFAGRRTTPPASSSARTRHQHHDAFLQPPAFAVLRGGAEAPTQERELTLDEKVHAAMKKLGLQPPLVEQEETPPTSDTSTVAENCPDGVCAMPGAAPDTTPPPPPPKKPQDPIILVDRISQTMKVDSSMVWAALGATSTTTTGGSGGEEERIYNEQAAREMIALELEMIAQIREDSEEVQQLVDEGWGKFMARRALAFAERNVADARAILMADKLDEEEEEAAAAAAEQQAQQNAAPFKTVNVDANFDPTQMGNAAGSSNTAASSSPSPKPATKESVVFEATTAQIQELVLESPVPVLLDIYADWCGPCKALSPLLEEMAIKGGGAFRLVKVNSDNERTVSAALEVQALPTIFGIRDGKIQHMFQGMPKSEEMMRNFLMGLLVPGQAFNPPVTETEKQKYAELSTKLIKVAGSAAFPFSARERLQDRVSTLLDDLVTQTGDVYDAEQSAKTVRALLSNCIRDPFNAKFRSVNLGNKVISAKVSQYSHAVALLKITGFQADDNNTLTLGKGKNIVNMAPLTFTRDAIDKWIDKTRNEVAKAARKRKDEEDRVQVAEDLAKAAAEAEKRAHEEEVEVPKIDPNACKLKLRLDGKNKSHDVSMHADDTLSSILGQIPGLSITDDEEFQITCVAKRLIVNSSDSEALNKSLREHGLMPAAALVVKIKNEAGNAASTSTSSLSQRAAANKKKKGSHTMQSTGIYGKDDNAKGELIDGGGGTLYEQDVTDDEEEQPAEEETEEASAETMPDENDAQVDDETIEDEGEP